MLQLNFAVLAKIALSCCCGLVALGAPMAAIAEKLDPRGHIQTAIQKIEDGEYSLARTYLGPALIAPQLNPTERSRAYYLRGFSYQAQGLHTSALKDYHRAIEFNRENPGAQVALGVMYNRGLGAAQNLELAVELFNGAAEAGHPAGKFHLGLAHLQGRGLVKNIASGRRWLEDAASDDYVPAMEFLAQSYRPGQGDDPNAELAKQWYETALSQGSEDARTALAYMLANGELGEKDEPAAAAMLQEAADAGSAKAQVALSHYYLVGSGVTKNTAKAVELLEQAAEQGSGQAYFRLGYLYQTGQGFSKDLGQAKARYEVAANAGLPLAQRHLALLLLQSDNAQDHVTASRWLERTTLTNQPQALNDFAWVLATSKHPEVRDGEQALAYAQRAVETEADEGNRSSYLDTLAAAYAELGRFAEAIEAQQQALEAIAAAQQSAAAESEAAAAPSPALTQELERHLDAYSKQQPWRE